MEVHLYLQHEQRQKGSKLQVMLSEHGEKLSFDSEAGLGTCVREPRHLWRKISEVFSDINPELGEL